MLYPWLMELTKYIRSKGLKASLITNGSLMNEEWIKNYAGMYDTIGFSVDSLNDETNKKIGRCNRRGKTVSTGRIVELCGLIRKYAPGCRIKINTVVSALNKDEVNMSSSCVWARLAFSSARINPAASNFAFL